MYERINSSYDYIFATKYALKAKIMIKFKTLSNWFTMSD